MLPPRKLYLVSDADWQREIQRVGADPGTWPRLRKKCRILSFSAGPFSPPAAIILKQCMLSGGGDAIVAREVITCGCSETGVLLVGTEKQIRSACLSMRGQAFGLAELAAGLEAALETPQLPATLSLGDSTLEYGENPLIMGILNVTPDSFSDGGSYIAPGAALEHALEMKEEGAVIIDVGGESTKPGSLPVSSEEQIRRIVPVIRSIRSRTDIPVSVDTTSAKVAAAALDAGAVMVNDISAMSDPDMPGLIASKGVPVALMHMLGVPETMQEDPCYENVFDEVLGFLQEKVKVAGRNGIPRERILVDPGIGFGKKLTHNIVLLNRLCDLRATGCRTMLGHSRKSFLRLLTGEDGVSSRDACTHVVSALLRRSVDVLRVHDVGGTVRSLRVAEALDAGR